MSDSLNNQPDFQEEGAATEGPAIDARRERHPDAAGVGRAQRSEPERSEGERSGARPTPAPSPSYAPNGALPPEVEDPSDDAAAGILDPARLRLTGRIRGRRLVKKDVTPAPALTAEQRLLLLDTWQRSGLPAGDFAALVGMSKHTLYLWKKKFDAQGPAGLMDQPRGGPRGSRLPELTKRSILMLKQANPDWGCQRISDMLTRGPALTVIDSLWRLFQTHGVPLVLKADNGPAFIADATQDFLSYLGVNLLFSPPHTPWYNGSIEAGIGSLKTRTERHASRAGHPAYWTSDDTAAAQTEANATARPQGEAGPTPDELWRTRRPITPEARRLFQETVIRNREEAGEREDLPRTEERRMHREAIRRALEEHGILLSSRRRIPLPIPKQKAAIIT